ncbi:MAG: hypothetical protein V1492_02465 [Candidatus Micrarchaeota archaeon]
MRFNVLFLVAAVLLSSLSFAQYTDIGSFTCPSGQVEDTQCAAACCSNYGGQYSFSDESCLVNSQADWPLVVQCEQANNCCKSAYDNTPSSGGCCGSAAILLLVGLLAFKGSS